VPEVVGLEEESVLQAATPVKAAAAPAAPVTFIRSRRVRSIAQGNKVPIGRPAFSLG